MLMESLKGVQKKYKFLVEKCIEKKLILTTMESCTGGFIASLITDVDHSSEIFKGSFVTYSNESKSFQGANHEIIEKYGVYSAETAKEMAFACKNAYKANIAIGITGTLGIKDPNNTDSVPGEVFVGIAYNDSYFDLKIDFNPVGDKFDHKVLVASKIVDFICKNVAFGV